MPAPRTHTAALERVRKVADQALETVEGITVNFTVMKYGDLNVCAKMSRSLQTSFSSLRARDRNKHFNPGSPHLDPVSRFDKLICTRMPLPNNNGWCVAFFKEGLSEDWEVIDNATGEDLTNQSKRSAREDQLVEKLFMQRHAFTAEDRRELEGFNPLWAEERFPGDASWEQVHGTVTTPFTPIRVPVKSDPNDIPIDVDPFAKPIDNES